MKFGYYVNGSFYCEMILNGLYIVLGSEDIYVTFIGKISMFTIIQGPIDVLKATYSPYVPMVPTSERSRDHC